MKTILIALAACCAFAGAASARPAVALVDDENVHPPHIALMDDENVHPPHVALTDDENVHPPHAL